MLNVLFYTVSRDPVVFYSYVFNVWSTQKISLRIISARRRLDSSSLLDDIQ